MKCSIPSCNTGHVFADTTRTVRLVLGHNVDPDRTHYWRKGDPCGHVTSRCDKHQTFATVCRSC